MSRWHAAVNLQGTWSGRPSEDFRAACQLSSPRSGPPMAGAASCASSSQQSRPAALQARWAGACPSHPEPLPGECERIARPPDAWPGSAARRPRHCHAKTSRPGTASTQPSGPAVPCNRRSTAGAAPGPGRGILCRRQGTVPGPAAPPSHEPGGAELPCRVTETGVRRSLWIGQCPWPRVRPDVAGMLAGAAGPSASASPVLASAGDVASSEEVGLRRLRECLRDLAGSREAMVRAAYAARRSG